MAGTANLIFPLFNTTSGNWANISTPLFTVAGTGVSGNTGTASVGIPLFTLSGAGGPSVGSVDWSMFTVTGTGESGSIGIYDRTWPLFKVVATGKRAGASALSWSLFTLTGLGGESTPADVTLSWPLFTIAGSGQSIAQPIGASDYVVWVINTDTKAHSTYDNFLVTSQGTFNGVELVATADGLFELTGEDDAGTDIDAKVYWVPSALGTSKQKKSRSAFVNIRAGGQDFKLVAFADEVEKRIYGQDMTGFPANMHRKRVEFTRNLEGQIWQYGVENTDGSRFSLSDIEIDYIPGKRKLK